MTAKPRFIAGAVCPRCGIVDRTVIEDDGALRRRRCIDCGFTDVMETAAPVHAPRGRLDGSPTSTADSREGVPERAVRIVATNRPDDDPQAHGEDS